MGQVEILPDLTVQDTGSRTLVGGAGSLLATINDASDATYVQAAGTLAQSWDAYFRFAAPSIPAGAAIRSVQVKMRHSHATFSVGSANAEFMQPIAVLVGRGGGALRATYDAYDTAGAHLHLLGVGLTATDVTLSRRTKDWSGKFYLGERAQILSSRRFYVSVSVTRQGTPLNLVRLYRLSLLVNYDERPTVTLSNPSGTEVLSRPPFDWEWSDPEGSVQQTFDARIYTQAMANDPNFDVEDMNAWPPEYRRQVHSPISHHDLVSGFGENLESYRAYLRASHADVWNPGYIQVYVLSGAPPLSPLTEWDTSDFTLVLDAPRPPDVTAVYDPSAHGIRVHVQGLDNMLDYEASTFDTGTGGWAAGNANTTLAQTGATGFHGGDALQLTRTASTGDASANGPAVPVIGGEVYTATARFRANSTSRTAQITGAFFSESGALVGGMASLSNTTDVSTGYRMAVATGTAPSNAAFFVPIVTVLAAAAAEIHFVDAVAVFPGLQTQYLTDNQASVEVDATGWVVVTANTTMVKDSAHAYSGLSALRITRNGSAGTAAVRSPGTGTAGVKINTGEQYTVGFWVFSDVARTARAVIDWYDAAGALLSSTTGTTNVTVLGEWTFHTVTGTAPASAHFGAVRPEVLNVNIGEFHWIDAAGFWRGSTVQSHFGWNVGGFLSDDPTEHVVLLERYLELNEHGLPMWEAIPEPRTTHVPRHQTLEYVDYEVAALDTANYRARIEAKNAADENVNSGWSVIVSEDMVAFDSWWLRDPLDAGNLTMRLRVNSATIRTPKPNTTDYPVGADAAVMTHDGVKEPVITCQIQLLTEAEYEMFRMMVDSGTTLLLQDVHGRQWYVQPDDGTEYDILRAAKTPLEPWPVRHAHKVSIDFVSVERPRALATASHGHG